VTPEQSAASSKTAVRYLGSAFTECPKTLRRARELGLTGWAFFVAGLGAALGDVPPEVVTSSVGFIAPDAVRDAWETARAACPIDEIKEHYLAQCRRWGEEKLDRLAITSRLADLAERAVADADATGLPLFAAWRAAAVATRSSGVSAGARTAVHMNLLRHHRAGAHLLAVRSAGLTPLQAIAAGPEREAGAIAFGWQPPYPAFQPLLRRWTWAEAVTDRIVGEAFAAFEPAERDEFVRLADLAMEFAQVPTGEQPQVQASAAARAVIAS
jgi:hypothetical protein